MLSEQRTGFDDDLIKNQVISDTIGRKQNFNFVSEAGMYEVIIRSNSQKAKPFRKWVCGEVLPSIRKHGAYISEDIINDNRKLRETIKAMQEEQAENKEKIDFADICLESDTAHYINDLALYLNKYHIKIGQNQLFQKLIKEGYLYRRTDGSIFPKMVYVKRGYFTVIKGLKGKRTTSTVMVTDKGQMYFLGKFREEKSNEAEVIELSLFEQ